MSDILYDTSFYRDYRARTSTICPDCGHILSMKVQTPTNGTGQEANSTMGNVIEILWCQNCRRRPEV